ncbi:MULTISPECIES: addiction module protein [unclassified Marinobacter]|uniref:addiction module protein n=1 Tax=unclassified Marinobacter TaxID=83889 RepID=UPI000BF4A0E0|nr:MULTISPECIES: addiction module protein [unclassified Marinobacter]PFG10786.1 putative addiction module component (TIGR02574 family) [Marinobacter sp. LV10MA510-1]PFG52680.1 putative addiction module component (TIGR02574 family) [Marinobacter sp. LV10R520-4]
MTTNTLNHLRSQISTLSESERAALARELIMSLDGPRDDSVERDWNDEIIRRVSKVKSGKATLLSREEFRTKMRATLSQ